MNVPDHIVFQKAMKINYKDVIGHKKIPKLTGIPSHIVILNNLSRIIDQLDECSEDVVAKIHKGLDQ